MYYKIKNILRGFLSTKSYKKVKSYYRKANELAGTGVLPDFIIIGAMRCGTSSLYSYLYSHPQVLPAKRKEVHYFDLNFEKEENWYRSFFPPAPIMATGKYITGEASPYYLYHPHAVRRIQEVIPDVKIIILLRDPVDRAISAYWYISNVTEEEDLPIEEAFRREKERLRGEEEKIIRNKSYDSFEHRYHSYLDRGKYTKQIKRVKKFFSKDEIIVLKSEELFGSKNKVMKKVHNFLDIDNLSYKMGKKRNVNKDKKKVKKDLKMKLERYYKDEKKRLKEEVGVKFE
jgi:hypothetical protein